jgi:hypothetical protein
MKSTEDDYLSDESTSWLETVFYKEDAEMYRFYKDMPFQKRIRLL